MRLNAATATLPSPLQVLLLAGGLLLIVFLSAFGMTNVRAHLLMVAGVAGVMAFSLLLALLLAFPCSGDVTVSQAPSTLGVLGQLDPATGLVRPGPCDNCFGPP